MAILYRTICSLHHLSLYGRRIIAIALFCLGASFVFAPLVMAGDQLALGGGMREGLGTAANAANLKPASERPLPEIIGSIINAVLGLVGVLLLVYLLYGGFMWMTAGGTEERVKKAQTLIKNAIIGIVIIAISYFIADYVLELLLGAISGQPQGEGTT